MENSISKLKYKRVMLKIGGEVFAGSKGYGIDPERVKKVAAQIKRVKNLGVELAVVLGAGNIWRGRDGLGHGMDQATADQMGMLATVMNSLALRDALEKKGIITRIQTAIEMSTLAEPYIRLRAISHLEKGRVLILGAGTGSPFFTTDTAAALRAIELHADILIKATKVDGIYDSDPLINPKAKKFDYLSYLQALNLRVKLIDSTAISLCLENKLPIIVLNLWKERSIEQAVKGKKVGTIISSDS